VGKTALSIRLARLFDTSIISADSRQCFRELNIGVAKPSHEERSGIRHYFIDTHTISEEVNVAVFESYALKAVSEIFATRDIAIVAGGTGFYVKAFTEGLDQMPAIPDKIRSFVRRNYTEQGLEWLTRELTAKDPGFAATGNMKNPQRMMRALELFLATGRSITSLQSHHVGKRNFRIIYIGLDLPRAELYARINERVDQMMAKGLVEEVRKLLPYRHLNALQTVGYREIFDYLDGNCTLADAVEKIRQHTRNYAKRQLTWFRANEQIRWFKPEDDAQIVAYLRDRIGS
jgi:tRNA dimethylallyltransferase